MTQAGHPEVEKGGMAQEEVCRHLETSLASLERRADGTLANSSRHHLVGSMSLCPLSAPARTTTTNQTQAEMRLLTEEANSWMGRHLPPEEEGKERPRWPQVHPTPSILFTILFDDPTAQILWTILCDNTMTQILWVILLLRP